MKCPICTEEHDESRTLSFDGMGINSCGQYRERLATLTKHGHHCTNIGQLFAASPGLLRALSMLLTAIDKNKATADAIAAINKARV